VLTTGEVNTLEPVQLYLAADIDRPLGERSRLSMQARRFTLNLGSRRLVAADDYRNTTNGYTGVRADLRLADRTSATIFYTLPQQRRPEAPEDLRNTASSSTAKMGRRGSTAAMSAVPFPGAPALRRPAMSAFARQTPAPGSPTRMRATSSRDAPVTGSVPTS
jgi:hypothetical protein